MAVRLFASPSLLIGVASDHASYAAFAARVEAVATPYTVINETTYAGAIADFAALTDAEKLAVMWNVEVPWLEVITARQDASVPAAWKDGTYPQLQTEFTRQGAGTIGGGTTMAQFKAVAVQLFQDLTTYALANGAENSIHFSSAGWSFNNTTGGVPREGVRASATLRSYHGSSVSHPTFTSVVNTASDATGNVETILLSNRGSGRDGTAYYTFVPDGETWSDCVDLWTSSTLDRKNVAGTTVTPDFTADDLRAWKRRTVSTWTYQFRRGRDIVAGNDGSFADDAERPVAMIATLEPATPDQYASAYIDRNHWIGLWDGTAQRTADDVIGSLFLTPDADTANVTTPDEVWIWGSARYYWVTIPTNQRSASSSGDQKMIDRARCAWEKMFFGRPQNADEENIGADSPSPSHDTWYAANNAGDTYWYRGNGSTVWRSSAGVVAAGLTALGLTIDFTSGGVTEALAPYFTASQVAGTAAITQDDIENAIALWVSERLVSAAEASAQLIAEGADVGDGPLVQVYSVTPDFVPYTGIKIPVRNGSMRDAEIGEEINVIADGETPVKYVLCADGEWRQYAGGGGGGAVSDGDYGDIVVSSSGTVWTVDNNAITSGKIASGAVTAGKLSTSGASANNVFVYNGSAWALATLTSTAIGNDSNVTGADVTEALDALDSGKANTSHTQGTATITFTSGPAILYRASTAGAGQELVPSVANTTLLYNGTNLSMGFITNAYIDGSAGIAYTKLENVAAYSFLVRATGTAGAPDQIAVSTSQLIGRGSSGNVAAISLGSGLSMTGTTLSVSGGTGDVVGPASATDNALVRFDSTTGKLVQNSNATLSDSGTLTLAEGLSVTAGVSAGGFTLTGFALVINEDIIEGVAEINIDHNGLRLFDSDGSHPLIVSVGSNLTANRTLTVTTGDANRTITLSGDTTLSGTNSGDQNLFSTIAVSGQSDVVADSTTDTLTLAAGEGSVIETNASTDTITFRPNIGYIWAVTNGYAGF